MKTKPIGTWLIITLLFPFLTKAQIDVQFEPIPNGSAINSPNPVQALDIVYDDDDPSRQAFHIFLPDTEGTFPLVIYYHGGGFTGGSRDVVLVDSNLSKDIKYFLENGIAFASVGYRLIAGVNEEEGVIKCLNDSKRALQFIRHYSDDLNIIPTNIALMGTSAGSGTALWLGSRDEMADPTSDDPVERESTRVSAVQLGGSQGTYDLAKWESLIYADYGFTLEDIEAILGFDRLSNFYGGVDSVDQMYNDPALIQYREDVDMLIHLSDDDPPLYIRSGSPANHPEEDVFHHHAHSLGIHDAALAANLSEVKADIVLPGLNTTDGESPQEFLVRHIAIDETILGALQDQISFSVYPNPVTSMLKVSSPDDLISYQIYDVKGHLVYSGSEKELDVSQFEEGTFFIRAAGGVQRFIKK